ncbi:hypothetical protein K0P33_02715 [Pseudomonas sp. ArH3a]|nr:hypothetical protein [Pseudomonas sp. ArH3a]UNM22728.1 hypothetical protein K0P33_02715 [Pseudomonas sp. ArH3a]
MTYLDSKGQAQMLK